MSKKNTRKPTAKKPADRPYASLQLWPRGTTVHVSGDGPKMYVRFVSDGGVKGEFRKPTPDERRAVRIEQIAETLRDRDILCCDSMLVSDAIRESYDHGGEFAREWDTENVKNYRPDPADWSLEKCKETLEEWGEDLPDPNPWAMDRPALLELLNIDPEDTEEERNKWTTEELRTEAINEVNGEYADGLDAWRDAVNDHASEHEAEVYEWWRVASYLADMLAAEGECVMDNAYGYWWGRQTTGQSMMMDGTLQKVAARLYDRHPEA